MAPLIEDPPPLLKNLEFISFSKDKREALPFLKPPFPQKVSNSSKLDVASYLGAMIK